MEINRSENTVTLLDCATGSNLMAAGMPAGVCVEKWCLDNPDVIISLQSDAVKCGSDIVYSPTFGANRIKLGSFGEGDKVSEYNSQLVELSKKAVDGKAAVAGDVSSPGLFIAPFGDTSFSELYDIYLEQITALKDAGVKLIVAETLMSMAEARAALLAAKQAGLPAYITVTLENSGRTLSGMTFLPALITLQAMGAAAVGINCSTGPHDMVEILSEASKYAKVPLIAKPNACNPDNPLDCDEFADGVMQCIGAGARIVGGCCGTKPSHIAAVKERLKGFTPEELPEVQEVMCLCNESQVFFMNETDMALSEPISCSADLPDRLFELEDEGVDIVLLQIESEEELGYFTESVYMSHLPVAIRTSDPQLLDKALSVYQGRAIIDSKSELDQDDMIKAAGKFGAVIY